MRSKLLFSVTALLSLSVLFSQPVMSTPVDLETKIKPMGPKWAIDLGRSITGIIQGIMNLSADGNAKAELIAVQEGTNQNADGSAGWEPNQIPTGTASGTAFQNDVYAYVKSEILDQTDLSKYPLLQSNLNAPKGEGNARTTCEKLGFSSENQMGTCMAVVDTFFADKGAENTQEYFNQIADQRQAYAEYVTARHIALGYNVQQRAITDLRKAAAAPVGSDNEIGEIAIDGQTLDEMLKITVADVALQIEMMEADAAAFLLQQPVEMMPEEKPEQTEG